MMKTKLVMILALFVVAGCSGRESLRTDFAYATNSNQQVQAMNKEAGTVAAPEHTLDGVRVEELLDRYYKEKGEAKDTKLVE